MIKQLFGGRGPHFGVGDIETRKGGSTDIFNNNVKFGRNRWNGLEMYKE
jgi:hypothetical protein